MSLKLNFYKTTLRKKAAKGFDGYPVATIAFYGPDDQHATKVAVGIKAGDDNDPEMTRWHSPNIDIRRNALVMEEIVKLVRRRRVRSIGMTEQILGCPHEEGIDYPAGSVCPRCPFWAGRPRPIFDDVDVDDPEESTPRLPDRRAMEKTLASIGPNRSQGVALEQAQEIMWEAWDEKNPRRRIDLARKALRISDDCADAFVLLAEEASSSLDEATELYEKGVRAGERALGEKTFTEDAGHFWGLLETRPYMRARAGVANCLREAGKLDDAIGHYQELLRLNPNDNQGNRHMLTVCFVAAGRNDDAAELLESYPEEIIADWSYTAALVAFRLSGASPDAREKLRSAVKHNPHVPAYLLGLKRMPRRMPPHFGIGSVAEAVIYAELHGDNWKKTEGAMEWLKRESNQKCRAIPLKPTVRLIPSPRSWRF
jgi:tetratricopeptide (TPR) repeat protein